MVQFTGSSGVAELIAGVVNGACVSKTRASTGKSSGPTSTRLARLRCLAVDQDAYNASGQKCSAQSILLMHRTGATPCCRGSRAWPPAAAGRPDAGPSPDLDQRADSRTPGRGLGHTRRRAAVRRQGADRPFDSRLLRRHRGHGGRRCRWRRSPASTSTWHDRAVRPFQVIVEYGDDDIDTMLPSSSACRTI